MAHAKLLYMSDTKVADQCSPAKPSHFYFQQKHQHFFSLGLSTLSSSNITSHNTLSQP